MFAIRRSVAAWIVVLCMATPALGAAGDVLPWAGGATRVTPFEARASVVARSLAGPDVSIECAGPADWRLLAAEYGFDRELTWALTPLRADADSGIDDSDHAVNFVAALLPPGGRLLPRTDRAGRAPVSSRRSAGRVRRLGREASRSPRAGARVDAPRGRRRRSSGRLLRCPAGCPRCSRSRCGAGIRPVARSRVLVVLLPEPGPPVSKRRLPGRREARSLPEPTRLAFAGQVSVQSRARASIGS